MLYIIYIRTCVLVKSPAMWLPEITVITLQRGGFPKLCTYTKSIFTLSAYHVCHLKLILLCLQFL